MEAGADNGMSASPIQEGPMTRSRRRAVDLMLSRRRRPTSRPFTRARGPAPSLEIITQTAAELAAEKKNDIRIRKIFDKALRNPLVSWMISSGTSTMRLVLIERRVVLCTRIKARSVSLSNCQLSIGSGQFSTPSTVSAESTVYRILKMYNSGYVMFYKPMLG